MKSFLYLLLLPLFFVFHGYVENFRSIPLVDCLPLAGIYLLAAAMLFLLFRLLLRNNNKAGLMAAYLLSIYLFFGAFHDFTRKHNIFLHKYNICLPLFLIGGICLFIWLKKKSSFQGITLFLNYLLLIYLLVDLATLLWNTGKKENGRKVTDALAVNLFRQCEACAKPDIYLLLFDEYSGNKTLKEVYHYDNSSMDSFLLREDFNIQRNSRSNYFFTPFSMASILNMDYLNVRDPQHVTGEDYLEVMDPQRQAGVLTMLEEQGYTVVNNSTFDLPGNPALADQPFIPVRTRLITNRTMFHYLMRDIGWWFAAHISDAQALLEDKAVTTYNGNQLAIQRTLEESRKSAAGPRFVYMHVFMPHGPFLFDSLQQKKKPEDVAREPEELDLSGYLGYLPYTNARAMELITTIKKNTKGKAVILFLSDHGYRHRPFFGHNEKVFFNNQNAVYFPDRDYHLMYDSISTVNEFRVVFNTLFRQEIPLLKDSLIYLRDVDSTDNKK